MADRNKRTGIARQPAFEPVNRRQIKVVGRFVQQQQVRLLRQRASQSGAAAFTAAGAFGRAVQVDPELFSNRFHRVLGRGIFARQCEFQQRGEVRPFSKDESARLLEPWLGSGLSIEQLPVPRVIVARVQPGTTPDLAALRARVLQAAPSASVDDHRAWIERMRSMTGATVFAGIGILALVIVATIISVSFATRGAMAANRPIVEVLHFVGAGDTYIANRFLRHFLRLGLEGGVIGGGAAMLGFGFSESIASWFSGTPVGDQFAALLGTFSLRPSGYLALAAQAVLIATITAWASRRTLFATLDEID